VTSREPTRLGEVLRAAREARFIDLPRVERDTKIRVRYLVALENGDYRELPGAVYTRGFLRNYGIYLGLDPEYLIDLYRLEAGTPTERRVAPTAPQPVSQRQGRPLVISSGAVAAVILTAMVGLFVIYLAGEFITFARTPELRITDPATDLAAFSGTEYTIHGVTEPDSTVTVDGLRENPTVTAAADGSFAITIGLVPGANVITLVASDPLTGRDSAEVRRSITVVGVDPSNAPEGAVVISEPADGQPVSPGGVEVSGRAAAGAALRLSVAFVDVAPATFSIVALSGVVVPLPDDPPAAPGAQELLANAAGRWSTTLQLAPGTWDVSVEPADGAAAASARRIVVAAGPGLSGLLSVAGGRSYLEIDEDGTPKAEISGREAEAGSSIELTADGSLRIRVGNAGAVSLTINGVPLPRMGGAGAVVEWLITAVP